MSLIRDRLTVTVLIALRVAMMPMSPNSIAGAINLTNHENISSRSNSLSKQFKRKQRRRLKTRAAMKRLCGTFIHKMRTHPEIWNKTSHVDQSSQMWSRKRKATIFRTSRSIKTTTLTPMLSNFKALRHLQLPIIKSRWAWNKSIKARKTVSTGYSSLCRETFFIIRWTS